MLPIAVKINYIARQSYWEAKAAPLMIKKLTCFRAEWSLLWGKRKNIRNPEVKAIWDKLSLKALTKYISQQMFIHLFILLWMNMTRCNKRALRTLTWSDKIGCHLNFKDENGDVASNKLMLKNGTFVLRNCGLNKIQLTKNSFCVHSYMMINAQTF